MDDARGEEYGWAHYHPHFRRDPDPNNVLYLARQRLALPGIDASLPGAGTFCCLAPERQLTAPNARRVSEWRLPAWCYPQPGRPPLSYHANPQRWQRHADHSELQAAARGQEFVLDGDAYPEALPWAGELIRRGG